MSMFPILIKCRFKHLNSRFKCTLIRKIGAEMRVGTLSGVLKGKDQSEKGKFSQCNVITEEEGRSSFEKGSGRSVNNGFLPLQTHFHEYSRVWEMSFISLGLMKFVLSQGEEKETENMH